MTKLVRGLDPSPAARGDVFLFRIRWLLLALVVPIAWIDSTGNPFQPSLLAWLALVALGNLIIGLWLYFRLPSSRFSRSTFLFDAMAFGILPHLSASSFNLLVFYLIFPGLVGAVRYAPRVSVIAALIMGLPLEIRALLLLLSQPSWSALAAALVVAAIVGSVVMAGRLAQNERETAFRHSTNELEELRSAMDGAKLLYQTTDALSSTTNYEPVLDAMLEAGVKGLPASRREDGLPVGIALFFDDGDQDKRLRIAASRNLDRRDNERRIPGKEGVVAQALRVGDAVVFESVENDPELAGFTALVRCNSGVCYPLQAGLEQYGVVVLASPAPRRPSDQHLDLMRAFTNQAALAFQNARLYQNLRAEHDQIIQNENEMRQKLARDLHDGPTQKVAALAMQLDYISRLLDKDVDGVRVELKKARTIALQTVKEIRTSLYALRPLALETRGLSAALEQYCQRLTESESVALQIEAGRFGTELDPNVAATVFAIVDEAVNNARKHAAGSRIRVRVYRQNESLLAVIEDNGPGFDVDRVVSSYDERSSLGLQNMRERAHLIDAELRIDSEPTRGTRVTLLVPHPDRQNQTTLRVNS